MSNKMLNHWAVKLAEARQMKATAETLESNALREIREMKLKVGEYPIPQGLTLVVGQRAVSEPIPEKVRQKIKSEKTFMSVIKVIKERLKEVMLPEDIDKCSGEPVITITYSIRKTKS